MNARANIKSAKEISHKMTMREVQNKYCNHIFEKNINGFGYPPILISTDQCQLCGIPIDFSTPQKDGEG